MIPGPNALELTLPSTEVHNVNIHNGQKSHHESSNSSRVLACCCSTHDTTKTKTKRLHIHSETSV